MNRISKTVHSLHLWFPLIYTALFPSSVRDCLWNLCKKPMFRSPLSCSFLVSVFISRISMFLGLCLWKVVLLLPHLDSWSFLDSWAPEPFCWTLSGFWWAVSESSFQQLYCTGHQVHIQNFFMNFQFLWSLALKTDKVIFVELPQYCHVNPAIQTIFCLTITS